MFLHFNNGNPHRILSLANFIEIPAGGTVFKQQSVINIFVIHRQQPMLRIVAARRQAEPGHTVVMHTGLSGLFFGGVAAVFVKLRHIAR